MRRTLAIATAISLAGCAMIPNEIPPAQQERLNAALAATCPGVAYLLASHTPLVATWPSAAQTAFWSMVAACPPNSPPTTLTQIAAIIAAAHTLHPYLARLHAL